MLKLESASSRYHVCQFSGKTDTFDFFGSNLPKNRFWGLNFKKLSLDFDSAPPSSLANQFSVKIDDFEFLGLNLGKLPDNCDIKVRIMLRVLQDAQMSWVEVEMSRVHCLIIPNFKNTFQMNFGTIGAASRIGIVYLPSIKKIIKEILQTIDLFHF